MRYRTLGGSGLRVSELLLGAMRFDAEHAPGIVDAYADAGGNVIDTASAYGDSEEILGAVLAARRDRFVLATKYGLSRDDTDPNAAGAHRKNLRLSLERSLRRLRTDHVDLFYLHIWDRHTPVEETMRALDDAVRAGKVLHVGLSDTPAWRVAQAHTLAQWHGWPPVVAVQVPYGLACRDAERDLIPAAEALGMTVAGWGPLDGGTLGGRARSGRRSEPDGDLPRTVHAVADELGATPAQVALAWTRTRSRVVHPLVGATRAEQIVDSMAATDLDLPPDAVTRLDSASGFVPGFFADFIRDEDPT